jgi:hypothetical protein
MCDFRLANPKLQAYILKLDNLFAEVVFKRKQRGGSKFWGEAFK